ncbi:O-antigen ligase family protein [Marmoricola sp. RAF53]|uniref:O-antigen ligase family protein n=1 Tax=Marmoricola sp. RAF53 TaxID=3233059 RepID=UPI003F956152
MKSLGVTLLGGFVLLVLVAIASVGTLIPIAIAVGAAVGLTLMVALGPERLGILLLLLATLLAPLNGLRISQSGNVGYADFAYVVGIVLVTPRLLKTRTLVPKVWLLGCTILVLDVLITSLLLPVPILGILGFVKIGWSMILLPLVFNRLRPGFTLLNAFAWAFISGQIISTLYGLAHGQTMVTGGRGSGMTTHPNFYGLAGQMSLALLIFLWYRTPARHRWVLWGAALLVGNSIVSSGSRASLICAVVTVIAWALLERTAISSFLLVTGVALSAAFLNVVFAVAPADSAFGRLAGKSASNNSDIVREHAFAYGFRQFKDRPIAGSGFFDVLGFHNVYLEVAVGGGIIALFAFILILAGMIQPLFNNPPHWLSLMALSYAVFCFIGPTLYDRILWGALAMVLVVVVPKDEPQDEALETLPTRDLTRKA